MAKERKLLLPDVGDAHKPLILNRTTNLLPCKLTGEEQKERGKALAAVLGDMKTEEARHDMLKAEMKSAMAALQGRCSKLQLEVSRGEELREVEVETRGYPEESRVVRMRMDTGEVMEERAMMDHERQTKLPLAEAADAPDVH